MKYSKNGDTVTLEMTEADYDMLLIMLGVAVGRRSGGQVFYEWLDFVNRLNAGNPNFRPYPNPEGRTPVGGK